MYYVTINGYILDYWGTFSTERRAWEAIEEAIEEFDGLSLEVARGLYGVVRVQ